MKDVKRGRRLLGCAKTDAGDHPSMLKAVRCFLLLALCASMVTLSFAGELQRRPRQPNSTPNGLDTLGLWQPESVRAILLLYSGKTLTKPKSEELEAALRKSPEKVDERLIL